MRVTGQFGAYPSPYFTSGGRRTENGLGWEQYLDPEVQKRKMAALPEKGSLGSVFMQFEDDYKAWKAQQPELALPDSQGWTEENLAFLKEHYSGDLSAYEVYDVLETMRRMGVISQKEENYASGAVMIVLDPSEINGVMYYTDQEDPSFWLGNFHKTPMVSFHSLDDILSWVEEFRTEEHPDVITHAEAMARGWVPYRAKV